MTLRAALVLLAALAAAPAAALDCADAPAQARALRADVAALAALFAEAERACPDPATVEAVGDALGVARFNAAVAETDPARRKALLQEAARTIVTQRWRALAALGEIHAQEKDWTAAAARFQEALIAVEEGRGAPPPEAAVRKLLERANSSRALAPTYTRALRTRSGAPGGVAARSVGGVEILAVPFPVEFDTDSAEMTERGLAAAQDMAGIVRDAGLTAITLIGHTDERGAADYNRALSLRRAEAVAAHLAALGLGVDIYVGGAGEEQPAQIDDPSLYTQEEVWQIMRRVELVPGGG